MAAPNQKNRTEVLEAEVAPALQVGSGGNIDTQVATARRFPRVMTNFLRRATEMATLTPQIAQSCIYAVPREGKMIEGPSARLAEIVAHAWGNMRIQAGTNDVGDADRFIVGRGEAWDVEANVAIAFEVKRRITKASGQRYGDDMVMTTGNAAASIALRNAVFKAIPASFWKPIYDECRKVIAGDVATFATRRDEMIKAFGIMGVTEERLCAAVGVKGRADIGMDQIVSLRGFYNALKDGETTIEEAFPEGGGLGAPTAAKRKSEQTDAKPETKTEAKPEPAAPKAESQPAQAEPQPEPVPEPAVTEPPSQVGAVEKVERAANGFIIRLDTGYRCATIDKELADAAEKARDSKARVELVTRKSSNPAKFLPTLEEILAADGGDQ
ncbi:MAG: hypothetical protein KAY59_10050 [Acidobacteria bacterium]|nr:hypothetical protein [Acidobacteriota bacterium]